ncbi:dTDP-4-dehydrorhamnose 3,5-epimerase [Marivirga atlantica]|jgi:dTDP-4-dehydrorhamnose 3,5-epimerase|uniref:dTDP-4-dehydrorhamnose 3,5-epimerase n=1 Tax=Marivirga atlantica TaxID=1548457 RepID=A0A937AHT7_9BACT|nr:dTDP-4-dehydrorhamnose 3,5-epimerase [Marivirga atlantica]MBL0763858.1 dTDP-4-dehydrorhamnose 3,5-epimerase [Marivirga atlantica]
MKFTETELKDCYIIEPNVFEDDRGYFFESFSQRIFEDQTGLKVNFVQDNQSRSSYGVLRGLHFQKGEYAQAKLVRVLEGEVLDVAVDIRPESGTYLQHVAIKLSAENKRQLFVPRGFAHGMVVLSEKVEFFYKCDNYYNKASEGGIIYNDPKLNIDWILKEKELVLSDKDNKLTTI